MRLTDFLRVSVLLFAGSATALGLSAVVAAGGRDDSTLIYLALGWWALGVAIGLWTGRRSGPSAGIGRMMADARAATAMPELEPGAIVLNRQWPLGLVTLVAGGLAFLIPQVPAVATGYALILALAWRRQAAAVQAVEERDGVQFHIERTSPFSPTKLIRTPGLRRFVSDNGQARERAPA